MKLRGTDGVGGLISTRIGSTGFGGTPYYPFWDGNGNITEYVNTSSTAVAWYVYDAYGNFKQAGGGTVARTEYRYDGFGRLKETWDTWVGSTNKTSCTYYGDDTLHTVVASSSAGSGTVTTTHTRDALGNESSRPLPGGPVRTFTYNALGQLTATNGVMQYPVSYQYDDRGGRLREMTMGNQGDWREPRWITGGVRDPEGETSVGRERVNCSGGVTTWNYSASGWLTSKKDHAAKGAVYTYTAGGKLKTRTWERGARTRYEPSRLAGGKTDNGRVRCPKGEASGRRMRHHYDPAGRLVWRRYFTSAGSDTGSNAGNDPLTGDANLVWDRLSRLEIATASGGGSRPAIVTTREYVPTLLTWMAAEQTSITGKVARTIRSDFHTLVISFADRSFYYDAFSRRTVKIHTAAAVAEPRPLAPGRDRQPIGCPQGDGTERRRRNQYFFYDGWSRSLRRRLRQTKDGVFARRVATLGGRGAIHPAAKYGGPVSGTPTLSRAYLWGLDLSGTFQGAGGVGGHLAVDFIGSGVYYPLCDGNGNITEYLDSSGGVVAHYRYDPFGRTLFSTGTLVGNFEFRFSSKRIDPETGCYYYGYRVYNPYVGRWLSRDPIGEEGGVNLYGFVGNDGVNRVDKLGLTQTYKTDGCGGFHVHSKRKGNVPKGQKQLTYSMDFSNPHSPTPKPKKGHESEFDLAKAFKDWNERSQEKGEVEKMRKANATSFIEESCQDECKKVGKALRIVRRIGFLASVAAIDADLSELRRAAADYAEAQDLRNSLALAEAITNASGALQIGTAQIAALTSGLMAD